MYLYLIKIIQFDKNIKVEGLEIESTSSKSWRVAEEYFYGRFQFNMENEIYSIEATKGIGSFEVFTRDEKRIEEFKTKLLQEALYIAEREKEIILKCIQDLRESLLSNLNKKPGIENYLLPDNVEQRNISRKA